MESKRLLTIVLAAAAIAALVFALGGCAKEGAKEGAKEAPGQAAKQAPKQDRTLAKVGGTAITESMLDQRLTEMPPYMKQQLSTGEGRKRLLDGIIEEELMYKDALATGLDKSEEYKQDLARSKRDILMRMYYEKVMEAKATPTDQEIQDYYNQHPDEFKIPENVVARHILVKTRDEAVKIRGELARGANFADLAGKYSIDASTKTTGGLIGGPIQRTGNIKGLGAMPELNEAAFALKVGETSQPIKTSKGYDLLLVERVNPEATRTLEEAKSDITGKVANAKRRTVRDEWMTELKSKYKVSYVAGATAGEQAATPEDLFRLASEAANPQDKIKYYQQFLDKYPKNERAYEAKFMLGFTMAEELKDYDGAEKIFKEFLEQYPSSDLSDDAKWMLENMRSGKHPDLKGD